jgi:hypothetical protein
MKRICVLLSVAILVAFVFGCAGVVYIPEPPPAPRAEIKPAPPGPKAVWIDGHWKWAGNKYIWKQGHWEKHPKGKWVTGHYAKRGHGHVWVPGHWKR